MKRVPNLEKEQLRALNPYKTDKNLVMSIFCSKCYYVSLQVFRRTKNLFKPFIFFNSLLNVIIIIAKINFFY